MHLLFSNFLAIARLFSRQSQLRIGARWSGWCGVVSYGPRKLWHSRRPEIPLWYLAHQRGFRSLLDLQLKADSDSQLIEVAEIIDSHVVSKALLRRTR